MSPKTSLIARLTELATRLGETPTPLRWRLCTVEQLEEWARELERELARRELAARKRTTAEENDAAWFELGGTRD